MTNTNAALFDRLVYAIDVLDRTAYASGAAAMSGTGDRYGHERRRAEALNDIGNIIGELRNVVA